MTEKQDWKTSKIAEWTISSRIHVRVMHTPKNPTYIKDSGVNRVYVFLSSKSIDCVYSQNASLFGTEI